MTKPLNFPERKKQFLYRLCFLVIFSGYIFNTYAQDNSILIQGKIMAENNTNEALPGASVKDAKGKNGTIADANGKFSLKVKSLPITLLISNIGYNDQEILIYEYSNPLTIFLSDNKNFLNGVVVVGYGTQKRKEITGSISSIPIKNIEIQTSSSFDNILGGAVAGLNVTQSSGQPGATSAVRIRGGNSINGGNEPLYVIDGFAVYNDNNVSQTGIGKSSASTNTLSTPTASLNVLSTINPGDIESIEVLKDASATAIYGSRGANGVILITTKKGKKGPSSVSFQSSYGWQEINNKLKMLNGSQWAQLYNDIVTSNGTSSSTTKFTQDQINGFGEGTDWAAAALRKGIIQNYQISISGGDEKTRYAISGNYFDQDGILLNTGFKRYSGRVNIDRDVYDNLKVGVNIFASHSDQSGLSGLSSSNEWISLLRGIPIISIYNADGSFNYTNPYSLTIVNGNSPNPLSDLINTINETSINRTLGNFYAEYKIIPSLTAKVNLGADLINVKQNYFAPSYTSGGISSNGLASVGAKVVNAYQAEFTLNYEKEFLKNHYIQALAGASTQRSFTESVVANSSNFANDLTTYNSLQSASTALANYSAPANTVLISYLGRINYSYLKRYNLTTTLRADGSSRFAVNNKWGYFPSLGLSWNINEEPVFEPLKETIDNLKFRFSVGTTGNQEIGDYQYLSQYVPVYYSSNGTVITGYAGSNLSNLDLKWESTTQYNAGLDWGLWKDRITFIFDAYYKKTSNLLVTEPISATSGYTTSLQNIGSVSNKGVEFSVNTNIIKGRGEKFNWDFAANISKNLNKVESLGSGLSSFYPTYQTNVLKNILPLIVQVGQPLGTFNGYKFDGVVQATDDLTKVPLNSWSTSTKAGDPKYVDQNGDKVINSSDRIDLGNSQPLFTYGFSNTFNYLKFDLTFIFAGNYGNKLYNASASNLESTSINVNSLATVAPALNGYTTTNPAIKEQTNYILDSRYIEDASYLKLRSLTLGYTFSARISNKQKGKTQFRLSASAQNLLTFTKYTGSDPEAQNSGQDEQSSLYQGIDFGSYPSTKSFIFTLGVKF